MNFRSLLLIVSLISLYSAKGKANDFEFSGYGRIIAGYLDENGVEYKGYKDSFELSKSSLLGLQGEYEFNEQWSATTQILLKSNNNATIDNSGLEWLYLTYSPIDSIKVKLGKLRTPFFTLSDFSDVGFAYPWITPPEQVYDNSLFKTFDGIDVVYKFGTQTFDITLEGYYGKESGKVGFGGLKTYVVAENLSGVIGKINIENFEFRISSYNANVDIDIDELTQLKNILSNLSFDKSAQTLATTGRAHAHQVGIIYDNLDYFVRGEWNHVKSDIGIVPDIKNYYFTIGLNRAPFTYHITFANSDVDIQDPENEIPIGVSNELDQLAYAYGVVFSESSPDYMRSWTIGARWDVFPNIALKAELSMLQGADVAQSFFVNPDNPTFDKKANLYLVGLDWVF